MTLFQELSRLAIVGTEKVRISESLRVQLDHLGIATSGLTDTQLLQKALMVVGLLEKTTAQPVPFSSQINIWQPEGQEQEAPPVGPWFDRVIDDVEVRVEVLRLLKRDALLFPASYLPQVAALLHIRTVSITALLDSRARWFLQQTPLMAKSYQSALKRAQKAEPKTVSEDAGGATAEVLSLMGKGAPIPGELALQALPHLNMDKQGQLCEIALYHFNKSGNKPTQITQWMKDACFLMHPNAQRTALEYLERNHGHNVSSDFLEKQGSILGKRARVYAWLRL